MRRQKADQRGLAAAASLPRRIHEMKEVAQRRLTGPECLGVGGAANRNGWNWGLDRSVCEKVPAAQGRKLIYSSKGGEAVQSNATPIRFSLRQTMWQGMRTPSALKTRLKRSGRPMGLVTSSAAPPIDMFRMTQLIASPPNSIVPAINTRFRWVARLSTESSIDQFSEQSVNADLISFRFSVTVLRIGACVLRTCAGFPLVAPGVRPVERPFPMAGLYSSAGIRDSYNTSVIWNPGANSPRAGAVFV